MVFYILQKMLWPFYLPVAKIFYIKIQGQENFKKIKGKQCIIIANHRGILDFIWIGAAIPWRDFLRFDFRCMMKERWIKLFPFMKLFGVYAVRYHCGLEKSLKRTRKMIRRGKSLLIFPEGSVSKDNQPLEAKPGIAYLAHKHSIPIIPIAIQDGRIVHFTDFIRRNHQLRVHIGAPFYYHEIVKNQNTDYYQAAQKIMNKVNEML